ncbi:AOX, alternative oxidase mitochondrial precursor [Serpula lacrymans var. lacrymans S7.3]|uniref:Alternative oxidase n=2 Tax=Serpula lacrymans var. lacrymans TaxID=341189 RepID=F8QHU2_SERL3|nr:alternative oxidase, AOX [Serpula lacrymans var. lacrymans S7.9]EGN92138.1 AOX, alternative oxidase mitochondrial precursor [Serpula lacrymans var. lacrymans S7.3]EGO23991.1 alternative oxidase, AOX [Serpula lacrymans var. lacrymans S7.9]
MLKSSLVSSYPLYRAASFRAGARLAGPTLACRGFMTAPSRQNSLTGKRAHEGSVSGTEGLHREDLASAKKNKDASPALTKMDAVSTLPSTVHGDWVLFHPVYSEEELKSVEVLHREAKTISDKFACNLVKITRWGFDLASGYKHKPIPPNSNLTLEELKKGGYILDERGWLRRILFLETVAGVPGMVAAVLRHLGSLRLMRRDSGWIHTLLEEAENERMHLMTFMTLRKPSLFFRAMVLGAQGVFYNLFFLSYMISPRTCHRFVGYLEEEAVLTYTRCIEEIEAGRLPEWTDLSAPEIAKDYWRLAPDAKLLDVMYAVRSDESTHRFVNHSFANLNVKTDVNPFALREPNMLVKGRKLGFERSEAEKYVKESHELLQQGKSKAE